MKAIVVEDSRLARNGLIKMLQSFPSIDVVGGAEHPEVARELIRENRPDLIFLDIHMPGESGFELLESLDYTPKIIFTTAYSEYAVKSFDYNTVDYLMKPISEDRLARAIAKIQSNQTTEIVKGELEAVGDGDSVENTSVEGALKLESRIFVKDGERCRLVEVKSIRYIESCKNHVRLYFNSENIFVKKSLNLVEQRMPETDFFRVSRQYLVNLKFIVSIEEGVGDGYELTMDDANVIEVSRRSATRLKEMLSL